MARLPSVSFPLVPGSVPASGVYVLFEVGEPGHNADRIVRVGTHTGRDNLAARLNEHFLKENKDRSIFRKNIGRALLNRDEDPFLAQWEVDLTTSAAKARHAGLIDRLRQQAVEVRVSEYMRTNFRVAVVPCIEERLMWESALISIISNCKECGPSDAWLGKSSPKEQIRSSGLWLEQGLYKPMPATWDEASFAGSIS
jgi:hypothetical protein